MDKQLKQAIRIAKNAELDVFPNYSFAGTIANYASSMEWNADYASEDNPEGYHEVEEGDIIVEVNGLLGEADEDDSFEFCMQFVFPQDDNCMYLCYGEIDGEFIDDMDDFFDIFSDLFTEDEDDEADDDEDEDYAYEEEDDEADTDEQPTSNGRPPRTPASMRISDLERASDDFNRPNRG